MRSKTEPHCSLPPGISPVSPLDLALHPPRCGVFFVIFRYFTLCILPAISDYYGVADAFEVFNPIALIGAHVTWDAVAALHFNP